MSVVDRPPYKQWRVYGPHHSSYDFRSQRAAYDRVQGITRGGGNATVYRWEGGSWRLYERIAADGSETP